MGRPATSPDPHNTPAVFGVYVCGLVFKWIESMGGTQAMAARNEAKAATLYAAIDDKRTSGDIRSGGRN